MRDSSGRGLDLIPRKVGPAGGDPNLKLSKWLAGHWQALTKAESLRQECLLRAALFGVVSINRPASALGIAR